MPLIPGNISVGENGIPVSSEYADVYHSADGGLGQAREVFLKGCGLPDAWQERCRFVILETGFGLGLNFLATWQAFHQHPGKCSVLHFISVEKHPLPLDSLQRLHAAWPQLAAFSQALRAQWPVLVAGYHRLSFDDGRVQLTLVFEDAEPGLKQLDAKADAIYLDGFSPARNPDIWSPDLLKQLARLSAPTARLATWCVAGAVRQGLQEAGFAVERKPGFGRKKERLEAIHRPLSQGGETGNSRSMLRASRAVPAYPPERALQGRGWGEEEILPLRNRSATLIGAGIAGVCLAHALGRRGWQVTLVERHFGPAQGASGNPAGVVRPQLALDESFNGRLSRQAFLHTVGLISTFGSPLSRSALPPAHEFDGVLHLARSEDQAIHMPAMLSAHGYPETFARWVTRDQASDLAGTAVTAPGLYFPHGGWMAGPRVCEALAAECGARHTHLFSRSATRLHATADGWQVWDKETLLAESSVVVLTAAHEAASFANLPLTPVRGQITALPDGALPDLKIPVTREGYVLPTRHGIGNIGASFAFDDAKAPRDGDQLANLRRLSSALQHAPAIDPGRLGARVSFRAATPDRLPLVGAIANGESPFPAETLLHRLPRIPGLYALTGLGARGLVWGPFLAQALAARLDDEPWWLPKDLWRAVDPARFLLRRVRH